MKRTIKFLCALSAGHEDSYRLADDMEKQYEFSLYDSLALTSDPTRPKLLAGLKIYTTPKTTPKPAEMKELVEAAGGQFLANEPVDTDNKEGVVVIGCKEDIKACQSLDAMGFQVMSSEFILTGILRQKLEYASHKLDFPGPASVSPPPVLAPGPSAPSRTKRKLRKSSAL
ncbi:hypothetical protein BC938DRAFT_470824 [Jimgerdemannia flammicorona]|uniref:BRCT domain-containing protein n=1 Tax=Jimgerdemannia flammicorona TaxID=994334 RepID=A0A433Q9E8_9FUNG|nr:hypothetical protein BC938DRAFT_470824 [Jimgerdemannia flammicorona]